MSACYLDASAAVKGYVAERGSPRVLEILDPGEERELYLSRVGVVEIAAALFRRARIGETAHGQVTFAVSRLRADTGNLYRMIEVVPATAERAIEVAEKHGLRAYDCVQLAAALMLQEQRAGFGLEPLTFLSSDRELNLAAGNEGLGVEDPSG